MTLTGKHLLELGFEQGPEIATALAHVNAHGLTGEALAHWVAANKPATRVGLQENPGYVVNLEAENAAEVVDRVTLFGSIIAGDWVGASPWVVKARAKHAAREQRERAT